MTVEERLTQLEERLTQLEAEHEEKHVAVAAVTPSDDAYTLAKAAEILGISHSAMWQAVERQRIVATKCLGSWYIEPTDLERYRQRREYAARKRAER